MFICWSFSTFSGKEWSPDITNVVAFRATDCDTEQWARTAREAGMDYILFLAFDQSLTRSSASQVNQPPFFTRISNRFFPARKLSVGTAKTRVCGNAS